MIRLWKNTELGAHVVVEQATNWLSGFDLTQLKANFLSHQFRNYL